MSKRDKIQRNWIYQQTKPFLSKSNLFQFWTYFFKEVKLMMMMNFQLSVVYSFTGQKKFYISTIKPDWHNNGIKFFDLISNRFCHNTSNSFSVKNIIIRYMRDGIYRRPLWPQEVNQSSQFGKYRISFNR